MINSSPNLELSAQITTQIRKEHEQESLKHTPSGKLSAGQLGKPLLEQVLKIIGVPHKPVDDYALGLFRRGNSVEKEVLGLIKSKTNQKEVSYKDCVGMIDAIVNDQIIEIKSVKNSQMPYLDPTNFTRNRRNGELERVYQGVKYAHALQAGLYALALDKPTFTIIYVSADDLRTITHVVNTSEVKDEIDKIISEVDKQIKSGILPSWTAREDWQAKYTQYSNYPDWMTLSVDDAMLKLKNHHPDIYARFTKQKGK